MTRLCTLDVTMFCALLVCFVFVAQIAAKVGMDPCMVAQISFLLHRHYMQFYCSICNYTLCLFAHIQAKVGLHSCLVTQIDEFFCTGTTSCLFLHMQLLLFLYAHIQAKVGLDSCLVAQIDGFLHRHFTLSIFA